MCRPTNGKKSQRVLAVEIFEKNMKLSRTKAIELVVETLGLSKSYTVNIYGLWEGKKEEKEKPKRLQAFEIFENNKNLSRQELLIKIMEEVEATKGYAVDLYNQWNDDTPVKKKPKDTYIVKFKGRLRQKFTFDDSRL